MADVFNFSAGPAMLPHAVMRRAQAEFLDWNGTGVSVMEMSHRGAAFTSIANQARNDLIELLGIPDNYKILFLQGGATLQFSMAALNLARMSDPADYVVTGSWGQKAVAEARRFCDARVVASSEADQFHSIPPVSEWAISSDAAYLHYTPNETIGGVEFHHVPDIPAHIPLVGDFSSNILSRPMDISRFGLVYAGAQKNIGPAGLTLVIVRDDLLAPVRDDVPAMLDYQIHADSDSMRNTPPTYAWYLAGLVFDWLKQQGGLAAMAEHNQRKAEMLYQAIDQTSFYDCPVRQLDRSRMNVVFRLPSIDLERCFLVEAEAAGLLALKGHRSVGGIRASLYNAMPLDGVMALVSFMQDFESRMG
ncbi:MAG: 3-phosphoserine/phosphohydroxythreonine transaminase [Woeseiaceae bacterium]